MQTISGFLERYKNFVPPRLAASRAVRAAVITVVGIDVGEKGVTLQNGRAAISTSGLQKTEILMHKGEILAAARAQIGDSIRELI